MTRQPADGPARAPGRPRSEQVERAILAGALELMAEHSVASLSMEAIAARAGVAKTTVYRRWAGKDELLLDALIRAKGQAAEPATGGSLRDNLVEYLTGMCARWQQAQAAPLMRRLIAEVDQHPKLVEEYWAQVVAPRRALLHGMLRQGIVEGTIRADADVELLTEMMVAPVLLRVVIRPSPISDEHIAKVVDTVLAGARPPA
jgi:AcrR family transcriptional regulator